MTERRDAVVIGSGAGGGVMAFELARRGLDVTIVETMIEQCRSGPRSAHVQAIDVREAGADDLAMRGDGEGFVVLPTE